MFNVYRYIEYLKCSSAYILVERMTIKYIFFFGWVLMERVAGRAPGRTWNLDSDFRGQERRRRMVTLHQQIFR